MTQSLLLLRHDTRETLDTYFKAIQSIKFFPDLSPHTFFLAANTNFATRTHALAIITQLKGSNYGNIH